MRPAWMANDAPFLITMGILVPVTWLAVVRAPVAGIGVALAVPAAVLLVTKASARLAVVILGALFVFQAAGNSGKVVYFAVAVACCGLSAVRLSREGGEVARAFRPMLIGGSVFAVTMAVSAMVAHSAGTGVTPWFRDALPYILLIILPVVGVDAGRDLSRKRADLMIATIGIFAAVGFAVAWLDRRGASTLGIGRLILATGLLTAMAFTYALAHADRGRRAVIWLSVAAVILALLLVTGTRSIAVFALGFVGVIGRRRMASINPARQVAYIVMVLLAIVVILPFLGHHLINDPNFLNSKLQNALAVANGKADDDQSYQAREYAYSVNETLFHAHPWLGTGPGFTASLDSPWVVPAKIGLIGVAALLAYVGGIILSMRHLGRLAGPLPIQASGRGWLFIIAGSTPLAAVPEDKGLALALTLFVSGACAEAVAADTKLTGAGPLPGPVITAHRELPAHVRESHERPIYERSVFAQQRAIPDSARCDCLP